MMTKLMQEAVTEVASCGVIRLPTSWIFLVGLSFMMLAKAANTAILYAITPIIQARIRDTCTYIYMHTRTPFVNTCVGEHRRTVAL